MQIGKEQMVDAKKKKEKKTKTKNYAHWVIVNIFY